MGRKHTHTPQLRHEKSLLYSEMGNKGRGGEGGGGGGRVPPVVHRLPVGVDFGHLFEWGRRPTVQSSSQINVVTTTIVPNKRRCQYRLGLFFFLQIFQLYNDNESSRELAL